MTEFHAILDPLFEEVVVLLIVGGIVGFGAWLKKLKDNDDKQCKRVWRVERAFALFMKITIDENKKNHGSSNYDEVEEYVNLILKDKNNTM